MKSTPKWLMIPPVVALLLLLGPLAMGGGSGASRPDTPANPPAAETRVQPAGEQKAALPGSLVPRTPDMWKMSSALVGVLLLGAVGLLGLKKLRGGASPQGAQTLATLRQTMRLGAKHSLHAIEFDNRVLLVGEGEKGLTLIDSGNLPDAAADEATVLARSAAPVEEPDEGATPKDLLIPRPANAAQATRAAAAAPSKADVAIKKLNDFRALLDQANS